VSAVTDAAEAAEAASVSRHISRVGKRVISGYFDAAVARALKGLAVEQDTTVQALLARAINDLLERNGKGRPASEAPLPRGGAAQLARAEAARAAAAAADDAAARSRPAHRRPKQP
jgi:hypothetical protein